MGKPKRFSSYDSIVAENRKVTATYGQARQDLSTNSFRSMPQEPPVINSGIFGLRGEGTGEYLTVSLAADQTTNIAATNHVEFDTKDEDGGIELQTGVGQADGIFELLGSRKYILSAQLRPEFSGATGQLVVAWYDRTNAAEIGSRAIYEAQTNTSDNANQPLAEIIVTPDTNIDVEVRIISVTALTALANEYCTASLFEISLGGFGSSAGGGGGSGVTFPLTPDVNVIGTASGTQTINLSLSDSHYTTITMDGNVTWVFSNPPASNKEMSFVIDMVQDAIGSRTVTWPGSVRADPIVGSAANARTVVVASTVDGGTNYDVLIVTGGTIAQGATKALDNLASVAINTTLLSDTNNTDDLGSNALQWKDLYITGTANIDSLTLTSGSTVTVIRDEDDLVSNSDTSLVTQQSIKAYVDSVPSGANQQLSNLSGTVAVNLNLLPNQGTGGSLGSGVATEEWFNLFTQKVRFPVKSTLASTSNVIQTVNNGGNDDMVFNVLSATADRFLWTMNGVNQLVLTATELVCSGVNIDMENNNITDVNQIQITGSSGDTVFGLLDGQSNVFDIQNPNTAGQIRFFCDDSVGTATEVMNLDARGTGSNFITFPVDGSGFAVLDELGSIQFGVVSGSQPSFIGIGQGITTVIQTGGLFDVDVGGVTKMTIRGADIQFFDNVDFGGVDQLNNVSIQFLDANTTITDSSPGLRYDVPTLESHRFRVDDATILDINANGIDLATGATVDFPQTGSASSGSGGTLPSNVEGFIVVRVAGTLRRVPFYPV